MRGKKWRLENISAETAKRIADELRLPEIVARLLVARGVRDIDSASLFLDAPLASLEDPFLMADMDEAAGRIMLARERGEKIVVYGDYDADGITATAALLTFLRETGFPADYYLPERLSEGYGLNIEAVGRIAQSGAGLLITVDNGINGVAPAGRAAELGLDLVITDHHTPGDKLPRALAVLNPKRAGCGYPFKNLAGVGVAFKLVTALRRALHENGAPKSALPNLKRYLGAVALGSIADLVPLTGENRVMVKHGLRELSASGGAGLAALRAVAMPGGGRVTSRDVAFGLAPLLNSAGRMGKADAALKLLLATDRRRAAGIADFLAGENRRRKDVQREMFAQAVEMAEAACDFGRDKVIVLGSESWSAGVAGIVAANLAERYHLPAAVVCFNDGLGRGSARSIPHFNITEVLARAAQMMESFGGHELAAGFTIRQENFEPFRERLIEIASQTALAGGVAPEIRIDLEADPSVFDIGTVMAIQSLEPFGEGAPEPVFLSRGASVRDVKQIGKNGDVIRLVLDGPAEAIGFGMERIFSGPGAPGNRFDIVYTPEINSWGNVERPRLRLLDARKSESG